MTVDELINLLMETGYRTEQVTIKLRDAGEYGGSRTILCENFSLAEVVVPEEACPTCKGVTHPKRYGLVLCGDTL